MTMPLLSDADVAAVTLNDTDGSRIYRRSLTLVLSLLLVYLAFEVYERRRAA